MFYQNLTPAQGSPRQHPLLRAGVLSHIIAIFLYIQRPPVWLASLVLLLLPLSFLIGRWLAKKDIFFFSSRGGRICYRVSYNPRVHQIAWADIECVRIGPAYIRFMIRGRRRRQVSLGWLHYDTLRTLKHCVEREAREYHVTCTVVRIAS